MFKTHGFFNILIIIWLMAGLPGSAYAKSLFELSDAVSALRVTVGDDDAHFSTDLDGNGKIGLEDIICLLQFIADLRCKETYLANFSCHPLPTPGGYTGPINIQFLADASPLAEGGLITDYKWYEGNALISSERWTEKTFEGEKDWWWVPPIVTIKLKVITRDMCEYESKQELIIKAGATAE
jgi:hypothetical protein